MSGFIKEIKEALDIISIKGFIEPVRSERGLNEELFHLTSKNKNIDLRVNDNADVVIHSLFNDAVTILNRVPTDFVMRVIMQSLSSGSYHPSKEIKSFFNRINFDQTFSNVVLHPDSFIKEGVIYTDLNGKKYLHQEDHRISLYIWRRLFDLNKENEMITFPNLTFSDEKIAVANSIKLTSGISEDDLVSVKSSGFGVPDIMEGLNSYVPIRIGKDDLKESVNSSLESNNLQVDFYGFSNTNLQKAILFSSIFNINTAKDLYQRASESGKDNTKLVKNNIDSFEVVLLQEGDNKYKLQISSKSFFKDNYDTFKVSSYYIPVNQQSLEKDFAFLGLKNAVDQEYMKKEYAFTGISDFTQKKVFSKDTKEFALLKDIVNYGSTKAISSNINKTPKPLFSFVKRFFSIVKSGANASDYTILVMDTNGFREEKSMREFLKNNKLPELYTNLDKITMIAFM